MKKSPLLKSTGIVLFILFSFLNFTATAQNKPPKAYIKGSTFIILPVTSTILYGTSSSDDDGDIKSYKWEYVSGPDRYSITGDDESVVRISYLTPGDYVFKLTVKDNDGAEGSEEVTINVYEDEDDANGGGGGDGGGGGNGGGDGGGNGGGGGGGNGGGGDGGGDGTSCGCTKYLEADKVGMIYTTGPNVKAQPGDVFCIKAGKYKSIHLSDFHGTPEKPIIFKNCGGRVDVGGYSAYGIAMSNSNNFKFTGSGDSGEKYGFNINSGTTDTYVAIGFAVGYLVTDFEVDHLEVSKASAGVWCKTQVSCDPKSWGGNFTMRNVSLHDIYVHDTKGEGFYVGHTAPYVTILCNGFLKTIVPQTIENLKLYNCITDKTGWDGIQVAAVTTNCLVYNNKVTNYGTTNSVSQQYGILIGGRCTGQVYNNYVADGTGAGMEVFARYKIAIYNNVIINTGYDGSFYGQDGIFIDDRSPIGTTPLTASVMNNTIVNPRRDGVRFLNSYRNKSNDNVFYNNLVTSPGTYGKYIIYGVGPDFLKSAVDIIDKTIDYSASNNICLSSTDDAKFVNAGSDNYQITTNSPALNKGKNVSEWVTEDFVNTNRPQGGAFDVGAYEYTGSSEKTTESSAVTNTFAPANNATVDDKKIDNGLSLTLAPVPVKDRLNIYLNNDATGNVSLNVNDVTGKTVLVKGNLVKDAKYWQSYIDAKNLPSGMYYLQAIVGNKRFTSKFVVIK